MCPELGVWGKDRENLLLSYIIQFISPSIHTSPRVNQRRRKKDKGKTQRNREQTTGCREYFDNSEQQLQCSPVIPTAIG